MVCVLTKRKKEKEKRNKVIVPKKKKKKKRKRTMLGDQMPDFANGNGCGPYPSGGLFIVSF